VPRDRLTAIVEHDGRFFGGGVEVGVGEDDEWALPSSSAARYEVLRGRLTDESNRFRVNR